MKRPSSFVLLLPALAGLFAIYGASIDGTVADETGTAKAEEKSLKALMLTGGCCHDYEKQKVILSSGIGERANVDFTIVHEGGKGTAHMFDVLQKDEWWKGYDVVLYNFCFAKLKGKEATDYVDSIVNVHKEQGLPAVALHCVFHSHHWDVDTDAWEELLGVTSPRHGKHAPIEVTRLEADHPVMQGFPEQWTTPKGELYHVKKTWDTATALAKGTIDQGKVFHDCIWANKVGKARVFGTTIGHHNETMMDPVYLDLVTRGLLWAADKLDENGKPQLGYAPVGTAATE